MPAGIEMMWRTTGRNLPIRIVDLPCRAKYVSVRSMSLFRIADELAVLHEERLTAGRADPVADARAHAARRRC